MEYMEYIETPLWKKTLMQSVIIFLISILVIALINVGKTILDNYRYSAEKEMWLAKIEREQAGYDGLIALKEFVKSDTYQRKLAHELGLYSKDEQPLMLVLPPEMQQELHEFNPITREEKVLEPPYWRQWWELFFGPME
jgi:hypothetical protein